MVLESLLNPTRPEHRPFSLLIIGFVYATVGLFLGLWIFEEYASMIMIFLTVMAAIPLIFATITFEEEKDDHIEKETTLLREHAKALSVFFFFRVFCLVDALEEEIELEEFLHFRAAGGELFELFCPGKGR